MDSSVAITVAAHTSLGTWPVYAFGSEEQKQEWMPQLTSGEKLGAFGLTEPEAGSDAGNVRTTAKLEDGDWVINGAKQFITNSGTDISGFVTITARTGDDEVSNILVPNGTPGYEIGEPYRKMGWNASDTRPLAFDDARVPEENLVGPRGMGFKQFLQTLDGGRISVSAMGVGPGPGRAGRGALLRQGAARVRPADLQVPGDPDQARRHLDRDRGRAAAHLQGRAREGRRQELHPHRGPGQAQDRPPGRARHRGGRADPRRLRLHRGVPGVPLLPRRQDPHDRRGHRRGAADGDRPRARGLTGARMAPNGSDLTAGRPQGLFTRALALFLLLFAVYAATLGLDAFGDSDYGGDEPHYLLAAESITSKTATWT